MPQEPKRRHSIARKGKRRAGIKLTVKKSSVCKNCMSTYIPHTICGNCGYYKGIQVLKSKNSGNTVEETPIPNPS